MSRSLRMSMKQMMCCKKAFQFSQVSPYTVINAMRTKSKRMTSTQVQAALNLVQQINGDLEHMDIDEIAGIIHERVTGKITVREAALPKVDTNINLSEQTDTQETEE